MQILSEVHSLTKAKAGMKAMVGECAHVHSHGSQILRSLDSFFLFFLFFYFFYKFYCSIPLHE